MCIIRYSHVLLAPLIILRRIHEYLLIGILYLEQENGMTMSDPGYLMVQPFTVYKYWINMICFLSL